MSTTIGLVTSGAINDNIIERINELSKYPDKLVLFCFDDGSLNEHREVSKVEVVSLGRTRNKFLFPIYPLLFVCSLLQYQYKEEEQFTALHSIDYFVGPISVVIGSALTGSNSLVTLRGLPKQTSSLYRKRAIRNGHPHKLLFSYSLPIYYAIVAMLADKLIFKSTRELEYINNICPFGIVSKSRIIPTGVDTSVFNTNYNIDCSGLKDTLSNIFEKDIFRKIMGSQYVLYAGRITEGKGLSKLVKYHSKETCDVDLIIVGESSGLASNSVCANIQEKARKAENIHFHNGRVPHHVIPILIGQAKGVALLSTYDIEGAPKILQESLVMGTPCIGSNITGIETPFQDIDGFVSIDPNNMSEYMAGLEHILDCRTDVDEEKAKNMFDIQKNYQCIGEIYENFS